jgi:hypothetical protein
MSMLMSTEFLDVFVWILRHLRCWMADLVNHSFLVLAVASGIRWPPCGDVGVRHALFAGHTRLCVRA